MYSFLRTTRQCPNIKNVIVMPSSESGKLDWEQKQQPRGDSIKK